MKQHLLESTKRTRLLRRLCSLSLFALLLGIATAYGQTELTKDAEGYYLVGTADELLWIADKVNSGADEVINVKLTADIDYSEKTSTVPEQAMIGYPDRRKPYKGTFDGQGHTVNVKFDTNLGGTALFCHAGDATIQNLRVTGDLKGGERTSGIVGYAENSSLSFTNCVTDVCIHDCTGGDSQSGMLGNGGNCNVTFQNCVVKGSFKNLSSIGGFVGWRGEPENRFTLKNCFMLNIVLNNF